jgi:hypothetical protein
MPCGTCAIAATVVSNRLRERSILFMVREISVFLFRVIASS